MFIYSNLICILMLFVMVMDLILPFLLAPFYPGYSHISMVMSSLGSPSSPVRGVYNTWLFIAALPFVLGGIRIFLRYCETAALRSLILLILIAIFAIGAFTLASIFAVGETKELTTTAARIHGIGAAFGFIALLFTPLLLAFMPRSKDIRLLNCLYFVMFLLALFFFILFILSDKPELPDSIIRREGSWQRLSLLFMYIPLGIEVVLLIISE